MKVLLFNSYEICLDTYILQEEAEELAKRYRLNQDTWTCAMKNDCVGDFECEEDLYRGCFVVSFKPFQQSVFSKNWYGECKSKCKYCGF